MSESRDSGFTLIELLIILAIVSVVAVTTIPALHNWMTRNRVPAMGRQTANLLLLARAEAVKNGVPSVVELTVLGDVELMRAFVDADDDLTLDPARGDRLLGSVMLPRWVVAGGPAADPDSTTGFRLTADRAVFLPDGSVRDIGAFRFRGQPGTALATQFIEVRIAPQATGKVQIRTWSLQDPDWVPNI